MKFLLLSGSFHSKSRSLAILKFVQARFEQHEFELPRLEVLPFYCEDLAKEKPEVIVSLIESVQAADGIVVCSPEYNHSIPAVLKNAIDWVSRPAFESVLKGKPVSIITQAPSPVGGARAQAHIKLVFDSTLSTIQPCHEMMIAGVDKVLDENNELTDENVIRRLDRHIADFVQFVSRAMY